MKITNNQLLLFFYLIAIAGIVACNQEQGSDVNKVEATVTTESAVKDLGQAAVSDEDSDPHILNVALGSESHSTLVAAVQAADIEHVLVNAGPLTVFAPTNAGFEKLPAGTVEELLKPENKSKLATILKSHAAPGKYDMAALEREASKGRPLFMASGDYWEVEARDGKIFVEGVEVLQSVEASNGIIHVVDQVILPE